MPDSRAASIAKSEWNRVLATRKAWSRTSLAVVAFAGAALDLWLHRAPSPVGWTLLGVGAVTLGLGLAAHHAQAKAERELLELGCPPGAIAREWASTSPAWPELELPSSRPLASPLPPSWQPRETAPRA